MTYSYGVSLAAVLLRRALAGLPCDGARSGACTSRYEQIPAPAKFLLVRWLILFGDDEVHGPLKLMAGQLSLSDKAVSKSLADLVSGGYLLEEKINIRRRGRPSYRYRLSPECSAILRTGKNSEPVIWWRDICRVALVNEHRNSFSEPLLLMVLMAHADASGAIRWLRPKRLQLLTGMSAQALRNNMQRLMEKGHLVAGIAGSRCSKSAADAGVIGLSSGVTFDTRKNCIDILAQSGFMGGQGAGLIDFLCGVQCRIGIPGGVPVDISACWEGWSGSDDLIAVKLRDVASERLQVAIEKSVGWALRYGAIYPSLNDCVSSLDFHNYIVRSALVGWKYGGRDAMFRLANSIQMISCAMAWAALSGFVRALGDVDEFRNGFGGIDINIVRRGNGDYGEYALRLFKS